ncbi:MAG: hypothetical protein PHN69_02125 [Candidatus Pacebacteria bacterium]|nr:hypothetical protein [Candidatus Paceibacterota bacterium]
MKKTFTAILLLVIGIILGACWEKDFQKAFKVIVIQQEEEIFPIIGRATLTTDGIGSTIGFVIKDGDRFKIARYDKGSSFDNENFQPKFLSRYKLPNGETQYQPFVVTEYK